MSVHHHHDHNTEELRLIETPNELIDMLIADATKRKWATEQLINGGSKHKQVLNALLLSRIYELVQVVEDSSEKLFELQDGYEIIKDIDGEDMVFPVLMPINMGPDVDKQKVADAIALAPEHDTLAYTFAIQVIEWTISVNS